VAFALIRVHSRAFACIRVIVKIKPTERLPPISQRQMVNYLRATSFEVGLLLPFGPQPKFYRFVTSSRSLTH